MSRVSRLAGALLVESGEQYRLVGETKRPIDWEAEGFQAPEFAAVSDSQKPDWLSLQRIVDEPYVASGPSLAVSGANDELCLAMKRCFVIRRNGSISERLWELVLDGSKVEADGRYQAEWLVAMPESVWEIVRDSVLRC